MFNQPEEEILNIESILKPEQIDRMKKSGDHNAQVRSKNGKMITIDSNHGTNPFKQLNRVRYLFDKPKYKENNQKQVR